MHSINCLQGYSPIHPASWRNDLKVIKMCEKAGADMNHITKTGWSTLTCSLKNENGAMGGDLAHIEPAMEYLLKKGDKIGGYIAHIYSPLSRSSLAIRQINVSDVNVVDMEGATPLHLAAKWGTVSIHEFYFRQGQLVALSV